MTTLLAFLFVLGVLIFVHELGHFLMARRIGVRVLTFSLGFGPKLIKVKRGDTEYCISAIPLGGYVKMAGENPEDIRTGAPDEFLSKSKWQRFQVLIMGPVMNLVLAVVVMAVVLYQGAPRPLFERQPVVIGTFADGSAGATGRTQVGDRIVTVDDVAVDELGEYSTAIVRRRSASVDGRFVRDGRAGQVTVVPAGTASTSSGISASSRSSIREIVAINKGQPADAGRSEGSATSSSAVDGDAGRVATSSFSTRSNRTPDQPLRLTVKRGGQRQDVTVTPVRPATRRWSARTFSFFETYTREARPARGGQAERRAELGLDAADRPDARRPDHARHVGEAADGPRRDRRSFGQRGGGGLDSALYADGDDQPQPGPDESAARSPSWTADTSRSSRSKGWPAAISA